MDENTHARTQLRKVHIFEVGDDQLKAVARFTYASVKDESRHFFEVPPIFKCHDLPAINYES